MRTGPEHRKGWKRTLEVAGRTVTVTEMHREHRRMPRGHELVRQMSRGRPMSMVEESEYQWMVSGPGMRSVFIKERNGHLSIDNRHCQGDVMQAAQTYCENLYTAIDAVRVQRESAAEHADPRMHRDPKERLAAVPVELTDEDVREILYSVNRKTRENWLTEGMLREIHRAVLFNSARHPVTAIISPNEIREPEAEEEETPGTPAP